MVWLVITAFSFNSHKFFMSFFFESDHFARVCLFFELLRRLRRREWMLVVFNFFLSWWIYFFGLRFKFFDYHFFAFKILGDAFVLENIFLLGAWLIWAVYRGKWFNWNKWFQFLINRLNWLLNWVNWLLKCSSYRLNLNFLRF